MKWHRNKYWTTEMYLILCTKAFVCNDSFKTPPVWKNWSHALLRSDFDPFFHTNSLQILKDLIRGPLLWTLIFSSYFLLDSSQVIGWAILAAFFIWNQLRVSLAVFGIIVLLKCPPLFHLHPPGTVGVGTGPANINVHWQGAGFLSNYC